jgi:hypothetical protein
MGVDQLMPGFEDTLVAVESNWLKEELVNFNEFDKDTVVVSTEVEIENELIEVETFVNEFWTSKQRAANALHEISYRACFKPQLPRFFIERLTAPGNVVYDPFDGRGTTLLESAFLGRIPIGCNINPLSSILTLPRFNPPTIEEVTERLSEIELKNVDELPEELLVFYHPETLTQICSMKPHRAKPSRLGLDSCSAGAVYHQSVVSLRAPQTAGN